MSRVLMPAQRPLVRKAGPVPRGTSPPDVLPPDPHDLEVSEGILAAVAAGLVAWVALAAFVITVIG